MSRIEELHESIRELGEDELRVLAVIASRLCRGREIYGELDLCRDKRDFHREAFEEVADALVYVACRLLGPTGLR